jgi:hypothetical protein
MCPASITTTDSIQIRPEAGGTTTSELTANNRSAITSLASSARGVGRRETALIACGVVLGDGRAIVIGEKTVGVETGALGVPEVLEFGIAPNLANQSRRRNAARIYRAQPRVNPLWCHQPYPSG